VAESELSSGSKCLDFLQRIVSNKYRKSEASPHNFSSAKEMMGGHHAWAVCIVNEFEKTSWNHQSVPLVMVLRKICLLRRGLSMILAAPATGVKLLRIQDL
jgi:seryl-tRNA synthetase